MAKIPLTDFMPDPSDLDPNRVLTTRRALKDYLAAFWPELDTRPNSVFGDVVLTPASVLMTALEVAHERRESDLNLSNVANGIVYNEDFVRAYLALFGVTERTTVNTTGVIRMTFNENKTYVIDSDSRITLSGQNFEFGTDEGSPITILPVGSEGRRVLTQIGEDEYVVFFPISGEPGGSVSDGTEATTNISHPELISTTAVGDFDGGLSEETIAQLAQKAQRTFYSATLTTRNGAINFLLNQFPNLIGAGAVITGDTEMLRDSSNPMGVKEGKLDVFVKSRTSYLFGEQIVTLTFDPEKQGWVGKLPFPQPPAFYDFSRGIFKVGNFGNAQSVNTVYASSADNAVDNVGVAYSDREILGILVNDPDPQNFDNHFISAVSNVSLTDATLDVSGIFSGNVFSNVTTRTVSVTFQTTESYTDPDLGTVTVPVAVAIDNATLETTMIRFLPNNVATPTEGIAIRDFDYDKLFRGLVLKVSSEPGSFVPADLIGTRFDFTFRGRTSEFSLNFLHDPLLVSASSAIMDSDNKPAGVDVLAKNFVAGHVSQFVVNYRVRAGATVDIDTAREQIFQYVNSIIHPEVYEESVISSIMLSNGATGVTSVVKRCTFYPSLASIFVEKDGTEVSIPRQITTDMIPVTNDFGVGPRNINYILDQDTITFNATTF